MSHQSGVVPLSEVVPVPDAVCACPSAYITVLVVAALAPVVQPPELELEVHDEVLSMLGRVSELRQEHVVDVVPHTEAVDRVEEEVMHVRVVVHTPESLDIGTSDDPVLEDLGELRVREV